MYYIIQVNDKFVGQACGQLTDKANAFRFTSLLHAESVKANYPSSIILKNIN